MKQTIILVIISLTYSSALSQRSTFPRTLQLIELHDKVIVDSLSQEIQRLKRRNSFHKFGYLVVDIDADSRGDTLRRYEVHVQWNEDFDRHGRRPQFYTIVNERLVLVHCKGLDSILTISNSRQGARRFRKLFEASLFPRQTIAFVTPDGKKVKDRNYRHGYSMLDYDLVYYQLRTGRAIRARR